MAFGFGAKKRAETQELAEVFSQMVDWQVVDSDEIDAALVDLDVYGEYASEEDADARVRTLIASLEGPHKEQKLALMLAADWHLSELTEFDDASVSELVEINFSAVLVCLILWGKILSEQSRSRFSDFFWYSSGKLCDSAVAKDVFDVIFWTQMSTYLAANSTDGLNSDALERFREVTGVAQLDSELLELCEQLGQKHLDSLNRGRSYEEDFDRADFEAPKILAMIYERALSGFPDPPLTSISKALATANYVGYRLACDE